MIEVLHTHTTKVGAVDVNFTFGRITQEHRPATSDFNRDGGVNGPHAQDQGSQFASCVNAVQTSGCVKAATLAPVTNIQFNPQHSTGAG